MQEKDKSSLEFPASSGTEPAEDSSGALNSNQALRKEGIVRTAFRLPVDPSDPIRLTIGDRAFDLVNISRHGAQIACSKADRFLPDQALESMQLIINEEPLAIQGEVIYATHIGPQEQACGIAFTFSGEADQDKLDAFLEKKRQQLFPAEE